MKVLQQNKGLLLILLVPFLLYEMRDIPPQPDPPKQKPNTDIVAFDWENNREITKEMADTMVFTGGHWYGQSNLPQIKSHTQITTHTKEIKWLAPAGLDYYYIKGDKALERLWRKQQEK